MSQIETLFDQYPEIIRFPGIHRDPAGTTKPLREITTAADLPSRLITGDITESSFCKSESGWSADYADPDNGTASVLFKADSGLLWVSIEREGEKQISCAKAEEFRDILPYLGMGFPKAWDGSLSNRLENTYNLHYLPPQKDQPDYCFFPDGPVRAVCFPVPVSRLRDLLRLHESLQTDRDICCAVSGSVRLNYSVVNYLEGRNSSHYSESQWLITKGSELWGLPSTQVPVREVANDGSAAWTTQRFHYIYKAHVFLRDLERFAARLHTLGLLGRAADESDEWPHKPEDAAVILPLGLDVQEGRFQWFNRDRSRRTTYPRFGSPDEINGLLNGATYDSAAAEITKAENAAEKLLAWIKSPR